MKQLLIALILCTAFQAAAAPPAAATASQRAVLVTGASTGIGRKITEKLAAEGYFVYAGARKEADLKALGEIKNVQPLRLDVTKAEDIDAAVATVARAGKGLYALVNNAGIAAVGSLADTKLEEFDLVMAVNVAGPYRMTRAFLPLVAAQKGRVVTIGSISGIVASPDLGAYSMSKHAMEAFTDSLAAQLKDTGVQVIIVEPGNYNSQIGVNAAQREGADNGRSDRSKYKEPDEVAAVVAQALSEASPKRRYMVVPDQQEAERTIRKQIEQLVQLNEGQPYAYDQGELTRMLDAALATSRPKTKAPAN